MWISSFLSISPFQPPLISRHCIMKLSGRRTVTSGWRNNVSFYILPDLCIYNYQSDIYWMSHKKSQTCMSQTEFNIFLTPPSTSFCSNQFSTTLLMSRVLINGTTIYQVVWARIMPRRPPVPFSLCSLPLYSHAQSWWFYFHNAC